MSAIFKLFSKWLGKVGLAPMGLISNLFSFAFGALMSDIITPSMRFIKHKNEALYKSEILSPSESINLYFKNKISKNTLYNNLSYHGYSTDKVDQLIEANRAMQNIGEISALMLRKEITKSEAIKRITEQGYTKEKAEELLKLAYYIPTVPDFIRFAVRDVFTPEAVTKYGLFQDYPTKLNEFLEVAGLDPEYAKYYWGSHWELPPIGQAFDMYHRGIINKADIELLLKSQDVMPFWRDKIIKLAETPFTRVDLGRMYKAGVLNFQELVKGYQDIGYNTEKATKMAEFITSEYFQSSKDLSKTEILACYEDELISKAEATEALKNLGYTEEETNLVIASYEQRKIRSYTNKFISALKREFEAYRLSENEARVLLTGLNLSEECIDITLQTWQLGLLPKYSYPTKAEFLKWFKAGNITSVEAREGLSNLGYASKWIDLYLGGVE